MSASDYSCMAKLLPPLETLSRQHGEELLRDLASSVGAVIATHGAYRPDAFAVAGAAAAAAAAAPAATAPTTGDNSAARSSSSPGPPNVPNPRRTSAASQLAADESSRRSSGGSGGGSRQPPTKPVADWLLEACDPDVPTKAVALRNLTRLIQSRRPDAVDAQEKIFKVGNLPVYLSTFQIHPGLINEGTLLIGCRWRYRFIKSIVF